MNHDIAHCDNKECLVKDNCRRYKAHLESVKVGIPYVSYLYYKELKNSGNKKMRNVLARCMGIRYEHSYNKV